MPSKQGTKQVAANKKAYHDYFVEEKFEAGIELFGTEVKSIRAGAINLKDSYCTFQNSEIFVRGMHISPYEQGNIFCPYVTDKFVQHSNLLIYSSNAAMLRQSDFYPTEEAEDRLKEESL